MEVEMSQLDLRYARLRIADPARVGRLMSSLQQHGQQSPVLLVPAGDGTHLILIDGYARVSALRSLARDTVTAVVLDVAEAEALVLGHRLDSARRRTALEEGWLVEELVEGHRLDRREVSRRLQRSPSWVSRRLALVQVLPASVQDAVRAGRVPPYAAMKYLVPLARANAEQCVTLVASLAPQTVTARQVERLYEGWRRADPEGRERVVSHPWLFLRADEALQAEPPVPPGDPVESLLRDLEAVAGLSRRSRRRLRDGVLSETTEASCRAVERVFAQCRLAFAAVDELLTEELRRARSGYPHRDPEAA